MIDKILELCKEAFLDYEDDWNKVEANYREEIEKTLAGKRWPQPSIYQIITRYAGLVTVPFHSIECIEWIQSELDQSIEGANVFLATRNVSYTLEREEARKLWAKILARLN